MMLLEDLYTPQTKTINLKNPIKRVKIDYDKELGSGKFSSVKNNKDEHMVDKKSKSTIRDPYWMYIDKLIKDKMSQSNPYFPRIYSIKQYKDRDGNTLYKGTIEKLLPYSQCSVEELHTCYKRIFGAPVDGFDGTEDQMFMAWQLTVGIDMAISYRNYSNIKDEACADAVEWLIRCYDYLNNYYDTNIDLHEENIMFRRTKYGIQLVITDPFAST